MFGSETGSTSTALPAGQQITESGTDGLTIAKLRNAKEIMEKLFKFVLRVILSLTKNKYTAYLLVHVHYITTVAPRLLHTLIT